MWDTIPMVSNYRDAIGMVSHAGTVSHTRLSFALASGKLVFCNKSYPALSRCGWPGLNQFANDSQSKELSMKGSPSFIALSSRRLAIVLGVLAAVAYPVLADPPAPPVATEHAEKMGKGQEIFKRHIRPLFMETCVKCHG